MVYEIKVLRWMGSSSMGEDAPVSFGIFSDMIFHHDRLQNLVISLACLFSFFFSFILKFLARAC